MCKSWVNLQERVLASCSRKKVVFSASEDNARLLPRLYFHCTNTLPIGQPPAQAMRRIHERVSQSDGAPAAAATASPFAVDGSRDMLVCSIHCRVDGDTGCLVTIECSVRQDGGASNLDFNIPISPYGALLECGAEHRSRLGFAWQGNNR